MSDEVTRQMREARQEDRSRVEDAIRKYMRSPAMMLTDAEMEAHGLITGNSASGKTSDELAKEYLQKDMEYRKRSIADFVGMPPAPDFDPQLAINEFRACKQDPAFSAWATKWAVRLCRALGAE